MPRPIAVPRDVLNVPIAASSLPLSAVGGTRTHGDTGERDQADLRTVVLGLDEVAGCLLGGGQTVRRDIGRAHRTGLVDGQQDRRGVRGHQHARLRPGRADAEHHQAGREQPERDATPPRRPVGQRRPDQRDAGHPQRRTAAAPAHPPARRQQQRERQQRDQGPRPVQGHQTIRPNQLIIRSPPMVRSSSASHDYRPR